MSFRKAFIPVAAVAAMLSVGSVPAFASTDTIYIDTPKPVVAPARQLASDVLDTLTVAEQQDVPGYDGDSSFDFPADVDDATYGSKADMWDVIYMRDFDPATIKIDDGDVTYGMLDDDPYGAGQVAYIKGDGTSDVDIEHIVARSEAWDSGASSWTQEQRDAFANDPLELIAVSSGGNRAHGEKDAAEWLPSVGVKSTGVKNPSYDCMYVARQIAVKAKYSLSVDEAEKTSMENVLATCPTQTLPTESDGAYWDSSVPSTPDEGTPAPPTGDGTENPDVDPDAGQDATDTTDKDDAADTDPSTDTTTDEATDSTTEDATDDSATEPQTNPQTPKDDTVPTDDVKDEATDDLPQTGVRSPMFMVGIFVVIVLIAAAAGIAYFVLKRRDDHRGEASTPSDADHADTDKADGDETGEDDEDKDGADTDQSAEVEGTDAPSEKAAENESEEAPANPADEDE